MATVKKPSDVMADTRNYETVHRDINFHDFEKDPVFFGRFLKPIKLKHDAFLFSEALTGDETYIPAHQAISEALNKVKNKNGIFRIEHTGTSNSADGSKTYNSYTIGFSKD